MSEAVSKLLLAAICCKAHGSALSATKGLDVLQHASEPFSPPALTMNFSLNFASKPILKTLLGFNEHELLKQLLCQTRKKLISGVL